MNKWIISGLQSTPKWFRLSANGSSIEANGFVGGASNFWHVRANANGKLFHIGGADTNAVYSLDNEATFIAMGAGLNTGGADFSWDNTFACDALGQFGMAQGGLAAGKVRTSDGGATWVAIPNLPPSPYVYAYAGGSGNSSKWIAAKGVVRFTPDWGDSWQEKGGNLTGIAPIPSIGMVRVVGV